MQQPFDLNRMQVTGEPTPVDRAGALQPRQRSRRLLRLGQWRPGLPIEHQSQQPVRVVRSNRQTARNHRACRQLPNARSFTGRPAFLAYGDVNLRDIWIFDLSRNIPSRFTSGPGNETAPVWFPDGSKIAYRSIRVACSRRMSPAPGPSDSCSKRTSTAQTRCQPTANGFSTSKSHPMEIRTCTCCRRQGIARRRWSSRRRFPDVEPQFSPDVRWLAYASSENGRNEIYVQAFPSTGRRWQVSSSGGRQPLWRADGKELYFVSDERRFFAVDVSERDGSFEFGVPKFLFDMRANVFNSRNSYVPSRDGKRFLVNMLLDADDAPINIVQHWQATLK